MSQALQQLEKPAAVSATVHQVLQEPPPRPAPSAGAAAAAPSSTSSAGSEADGGGGSPSTRRLQPHYFAATGTEQQRMHLRHDVSCTLVAAGLHHLHLCRRSGPSWPPPSLCVMAVYISRAAQIQPLRCRHRAPSAPQPSVNRLLPRSSIDTSSPKSLSRCECSFGFGLPEVV